MLEILVVTYGAVFVAELAGDKLLYTTGVLATRFRPAPVVIGVTVAFMGKMAVAVVAGSAISRLPPLLVALLTTAIFIAAAVVVWQRPVTSPGQPDTTIGNGNAAAVAFATVFFSEWGDLGQVTAATLAARFGVPAAVWAGAVAAMMTKGLIAATIGAGARRWIEGHVPPAVIRRAGVGALLALGALAVIGTLHTGHA